VGKYGCSMKLKVQLRFVSLSYSPWIFVSSTSARAGIFVFRYRRNIMRRDSSVTTVTRLGVWRPGRYRCFILPRNVQIGYGAQLASSSVRYREL
jgi:hypothetical protein